MNHSQKVAMVNRYRGIYNRSVERATEAYIAKDMKRYMVNMQKAKDSQKILKRMGVEIMEMI